MKAEGSHGREYITQAGIHSKRPGSCRHGQGLMKGGLAWTHHLCPSQERQEWLLLVNYQERSSTDLLVSGNRWQQSISTISCIKTNTQACKKKSIRTVYRFISGNSLVAKMLYPAENITTPLMQGHETTQLYSFVEGYFLSQKEVQVS